MLIQVRCQYCSKLLCKVSRDFFGLVQLKCRHCQKMNNLSLAIVLKQMTDTKDDGSVILPFPKRAPA